MRMWDEGRAAVEEYLTKDDCHLPILHAHPKVPIILGKIFFHRSSSFVPHSHQLRSPQQGTALDKILVVRVHPCSDSSLQCCPSALYHINVVSKQSNITSCFPQGSHGAHGSLLIDRISRQPRQGSKLNNKSANASSAGDWSFSLRNTVS